MSHVDLPATTAARWPAVPARLQAIHWQGLAPWAAFAAVTIVALGANSWQLGGNGYGNTYYAAAARSMASSWSNYFFAAFDPGGFITVDKPPVFLWFGALTARIFGYSSWAILLPSAVAGAASVALLWVTVRRHAGALAATVAGAAAALSPIAVAVNRLNLPEPFLILFLVGAASSLLRSLESRRWWLWTAVAGGLVGLAFNTKMLAAWIPGPALALAVVAAYPALYRPATLRRVGLQLGLLAVTTLAASASWMLVVDNWPEDSRPYIGGSTDNTVFDLAVHYNGVGRVEGGDGNRSPGGGTPGNAPSRSDGTAPGRTDGTTGAGRSDGTVQPPVDGGTAPGNNQAGGSRTGAGGIIAGTPGLWRMFDDANAGQIAWLLPFALGGGLVCLWAWRRKPVLRAATALWLGWVLLFGLVFSYAEGTYHSYYTSAMVPGVSALTGMTVVALARLIRANRLWLIAAAALIGATLWLQFDITGRFPGFQDGGKAFAVAMAAAGVGVGVIAALRSQRYSRPLTEAGMALAVAGLLVVPGSWASYEALHSSTNTTLPQAGPRQGAAGRSFGSESFDSGTAGLAAWLLAHREEGSRWDLAVQSAMNASTLVAAYDLSVMPIGGFKGSDPTISAAEFADMVEAGDVRYVLVGSSSGGGSRTPGSGSSRNVPDGGGTLPGGAIPGMDGASSQQTEGANAVLAAVQSSCTAVTDSALPSQYRGSIYDCAGAAPSLRGE